MAFVRTKIIDGKEYKYLVKNERVERMVKQKVIKYIGPANPIYKVKKERKSNAWLFVRELTEAEKEVLRKSLGSHSAFTKDRARIILLSSQGNDRKSTAEKIGCDLRKVSTAIKAFNQEGIRSLQRKKAKGAKPKFTKEQRAKILMIVSTDPVKLGLHFTTWSLRKLRKYLINEKIVDKISHEAIRHILKLEGMRIKNSRRFQYSNDPEFDKKNFW